MVDDADTIARQLQEVRSNENVTRRLRELAAKRQQEAKDYTAAADQITEAVLVLIVGVRDVCDTWNVPHADALTLLRSVINSNETDQIFSVEHVNPLLQRLRRKIDLS